MKTKFIVIGLLTLVIGLSSCKKETIDPKPPTTQVMPTSMENLTAAPDFSWQTVKNVSVKVQGSHTMTTIIKNANGDIYLKGIVKPNKGIEASINIPITVKEVIVSYGPFSKTVSVTNNLIDCTFNLNSF
jgi:hypothetical protein